MAEYIDREALLLRIDCYGTNKFGMLDDDIRAFIKAQPTADVAPVRHGRWEEASDGDGIVCPFCRTDFCTIIYDTEYFNYCPNCGAKMNESEDKNEIF